MKALVARRSLPCLLAAVALLLPSCGWDGHFCIFGYTTRPNYDLRIRAVIREIEAKTPYKVASCREDADSELIGTVVTRNKTLINFNELGEVREAQTLVGVELFWRDLRPGHAGEILSKPVVRQTGDPLKIAEGQAVPPVLVQSLTTFIPELGQSITTAEKENVDRLAVQIVSLMEKPW
jgi:hypothetical protein